ncbi:MAG: prepilin-type cleavage/methylation protein [Rhizorhabdus sp.]|nr:prepilin-type cleavage/methylation protein [Rhizorhabdus sp.]
MGQDPREAGFTLIELIISLALFALIAMAGLALVESLLGVQGGTEGRLDRLAEIQRAMFVIDNDLEQVAAGPIAGQGDQLSFSRPIQAAGGLPVRMRYALAAGTLGRSLDGRGLPGMSQQLLGGIASLHWSFYTPATGWIDRWPPSAEQASDWPVAIAADIALAPGRGASGSLRRVVALPAKP